jgi:hypothetical protein
VADIPRIWKGKAKFSTTTPVTIATAVESYTVPGGGGTYTTAHAASIAAPISVSTSTGGGEDATLPIYYSEGRDYSQAGGSYTFPASMAGKAVSIAYQYTTAGTTAQALTQLGLGLATGQVGQAAWSLFSSPSFSAYSETYSGIAGALGQNYSLNTSAGLDNHNFEIVASGAYSILPTVPDADPAVASKDLLVNSRYGAGFPVKRVGDTALWSSYARVNGLWVSFSLNTQESIASYLDRITQLTNTAIVWSDGALKFIPYGDTAAFNNGATYTPNVTPIYDLDDASFITNGNNPPITVSRKAQEDCYNSVRIEFYNRINDYNKEVVEARDQAGINLYGWRPMPVITAHEFADINAARMAAQLILQRQQNVRNTFEFNLPWQYIVLEPMDLVTLTDSWLGLSKYAVRITSIAEASDGELTITAEEFPPGIAHAALYYPTAGLGFSHNYNTPPGGVSTPTFFEPPATLTTTGLEVWAAVTGTGQYWGGCQVWVSYDGTNYKQVGTINGGARYGTLTGIIASNAVPVALLTGQMISGSAADLANLSTLCWIGGAHWEYLGYQNATLTGTEAYTLDTLNRGAYGTDGTQVHSISDPFVRVDDKIGKSGALDLGLIGNTIYFKFPAFNVFGGGQQALPDVPAYTYTITGTMAKLPPVAPYNVVGTFEYNGIRITWNLSTSPTVAYYEIRQGASFAAGTVVGKVQGSAYLWAVQVTAVYNLWIAAVDRWGNYSAPAQAVLTVVLPGVITSPSTTVVDNNILFFWTQPSTGSLPIAHYEIRKGSTYGGSALVGLNGPSTFFTYFESAAGMYTYWITPIDTANNYGTSLSVVVTVSQPPDYILRQDYISTFNGTLVNAVLSNGSLYLPVNTTETYTQHFTSHSWTTPQNQISAGYPIYIEPALTTASYEEDINYGSVLPATTVTVTINTTALAGTVTPTITIYYKVLVGDPWTSAGTGLSSVLLQGFQYVRVHVDFAGAGGANLMRVDVIETKLSIKQRSDGGTGSATSTDTHTVDAAHLGTSVTTGLWVPFNYPFISANFPQVQINYGTTYNNTTMPYAAIIDYTGPAYPKGFGVFYDKTGTRVTGPVAFSWTTKGY